MKLFKAAKLNFQVMLDSYLTVVIVNGDKCLEASFLLKMKLIISVGGSQVL